MFSWFDTKEVVRFGIQLADDLSASLDKASKQPSKKEVASKDKALQKMRAQVNQFRQQSKLNFYKKSKLINEFRWRLLDIGYDKELVETITKELVILLNSMELR